MADPVCSVCAGPLRWAHVKHCSPRCQDIAAEHAIVRVMSERPRSTEAEIRNRRLRRNRQRQRLAGVAG